MTVTELSTAGAKARQISAVPAFALVLFTSTHVRLAPVTEVAVTVELDELAATNASNNSFAYAVVSAGEVTLVAGDGELWVTDASGIMPVCDAATSHNGKTGEPVPKVAVMFTCVSETTGEVAT